MPHTVVLGCDLCFQKKLSSLGVRTPNLPLRTSLGIIIVSSDVVRTAGQCDIYSAFYCVYQWPAVTTNPSSILSNMQRCQQERNYLQSQCRSVCKLFKIVTIPLECINLIEMFCKCLFIHLYSPHHTDSKTKRKINNISNIQTQLNYLRKDNKILKNG